MRPTSGDMIGEPISLHTYVGRYAGRKNVGGWNWNNGWINIGRPALKADNLPAICEPIV
jgi:hypothetical protein